MKIHRTIGHVTLNRAHPSYQGARLVLAEPLGTEMVGGLSESEPELIAVWDDLGAGPGSVIAVSDGAEAAQPFRPELKAVDAYCSAILDFVHIDEKVKQRIRW
ncbi:MAG: carbon dioxide concentrating mechanism protein CcmL [Pirellulaceae bacterium]|nr:MAG: carbon dioxide concentrating mechanism protein CcmL [Pirellulaceae bacterium]